MRGKKEEPGKKKPPKKKAELQDLPKAKDELTEEEQDDVKGGDAPPPDSFPTRTVGGG
jgi:hypothetical protein